jgi:hypothetical protein
MVHDQDSVNMWYHDTLVEWSIINIDYLITDPRWRNKLDDAKPSIIYDIIGGKTVPIDLNPHKLSMIERRIRSVEKQVELMRTRFEEVLILDGYRLSSGLITNDEYKSTNTWFKEIMGLLDTVAKKYRVLRGHKELQPDEYDAIVSTIVSSVKAAREMIRIRYEFELEILERERIREISKVVGT